MKKIPYILLFLTVMFTLTSYTTVLKGDKTLETVDYSGFQTDTAQMISGNAPPGSFGYSFAVITVLLC